MCTDRHIPPSDSVFLYLGHLKLGHNTRKTHYADGGKILFHGVGEYALQPSYTKYSCLDGVLKATLLIDMRQMRQSIPSCISAEILGYAAENKKSRWMEM